ncbi:hypothetical protein [Bernardetia sp.]|uniref:hypothetical protein n=1 Tax=Bernardetia sp. TaxID=1937974 RepID=UPI0025C4731A|nr:hypothetical protein [Bernardetia sp.]
MEKGGIMNFNGIYYTVSAILWLLVVFFYYQFYTFQQNEKKSREDLKSSVNRIYQLYDTAFQKLEVSEKRSNNDGISLDYDNPRGRQVLDTIAIIEKAIYSLQLENSITFKSIESIAPKGNFGREESELDKLGVIIKNESIYNQSDLYRFLYKKALLRSLTEDRYKMYNRLWEHGGLLLPSLQLFDKNKIGLSYDRSLYDIFHVNHQKTPSATFEFEVVVEKLGRNPRTIRTLYRTTPKEGKDLGIYDYEKIETIVEK